MGQISAHLVREESGKGAAIQISLASQMLSFGPMNPRQPTDTYNMRRTSPLMHSAGNKCFEITKCTARESRAQGERTFWGSWNGGVQARN